MNKIEKVLIGVFGMGICIYLADCISRGVRYGFSGGIRRYFTRDIFTEYGLILALSVIGLVTLLIVHCIINRKNKSNIQNTTADKVWFILSFVPITLDVLYGLYSAVVGVVFLWSKYYGFEGFLIAFIFGGILLIPILPLCIIWQIIYIVRCHTAKKAERS